MKKKKIVQRKKVTVKWLKSMFISQIFDRFEKEMHEYSCRSKSTVKKTIDPCFEQSLWKLHRYCLNGNDYSSMIICAVKG